MVRTLVYGTIWPARAERLDMSRRTSKFSYQTQTEQRISIVWQIAEETAVPFL